jgi:hypothetical protein
MRTGDPWPAAIRNYWHQWIPRAEQELGRITRGRCSSWALPVTAGEEERILADSDGPPVLGGGLVAISTWRYEMYDWLAEVCRRAGCSTVWLRPDEPVRVEGPAVALFDGSECDPTEIEQIRHFAETLAHTRIVVLLDFPRIENHDRALAAGAAAVLSKPFLVEDLFWHLRSVSQNEVTA